MPADCYWCVAGVTGSLPSPTGNLREALGCCVKCQVLSCGHHAQRDPYNQEYKCYDCLFIKLVASAIHLSGKDSDEDNNFHEWDNELSYADLDEEYLFTSFEDFKRRTPGFKDWFDKIENTKPVFGYSEPSLEALAGFSADSKSLLVAAAFILTKITGTRNLGTQLSPMRSALSQIVNKPMNR